MLKIATDGSALNRIKGGIGIYIDENRQFHFDLPKQKLLALEVENNELIIETGEEDLPTNNRAEMLAIIIALHMFYQTQDEAVEIITDSQYCILIMKKIQENYGPTKKNLDLILLLRKIMEKISVSRRIFVTKVKAHVAQKNISGIYQEMNYRADALAKYDKLRD
ncbi:MAG: hypothetical protein CMM93_06960 [Rickettsiales bacterium]|nr:hypothetical protein [Rickettsiales bacterium]|tara:strand:+ start:1262 stop:1756 length:495 start_codon:yes stop_codon:yes gene_type:complete